MILRVFQRGALRALSSWALSACGDEPSFAQDASAVIAADAAASDGGASSAPHASDAGESDAGFAGDARVADAGTSACDPLGQTGCAVSAQCDLVDGSFACAAAGALRDFEPCDPTGRSGRCEAGLTCRQTNFGDHRCAAFCDVRAPACPAPAQVCRDRRSARDGTPYFLCVTEHECHPIRQDCAARGSRCVLSPLGAFCLSAPGRAVPDGETCATPLDCQTMSACIGVAPNARCAPLCDPSRGDVGCTGGLRCTTVIQVASDPVGACL